MTWYPGKDQEIMSGMMSDARYREQQLEARVAELERKLAELQKTFDAFVTGLQRS